MAPKGERNCNWKGGVATYPNHGEMKRNRLIKLQEAKGKCEVCGEDAYFVHHLDGSKDNHNLENLAVLCRKCHMILHHGEHRKTSKYIRLYGMSLKEMAEKFGGNVNRYFDLHKKGLLKLYLQSEKDALIIQGHR